MLCVPVIHVYFVSYSLSAMILGSWSYPLKPLTENGFGCVHLQRMVLISSDEEINILMCDNKNLLEPERDGNDLSNPP